MQKYLRGKKVGLGDLGEGGCRQGKDYSTVAEPYLKVGEFLCSNKLARRNHPGHFPFPELGKA